MATTIFNDDQFMKILKEQLNKEMIMAADPIVKECITKIERTMREAMASRLISLIEGNLSFERMGADLRITIKQK